MAWLVLRRLAMLPAVLLGVAALSFVLVELSPFDPVRAYVGSENGVSKQVRDNIARQWGLDDSMPEQFAKWVGNLLQGDLGVSRELGGQPVGPEILHRAGTSAILVLGALVAVLVGGLVFGVLAAAFRGSAFDWLVRVLCYVNTAAPSFWVGLIALYVFSIALGWLPAGGTSDVRGLDPTGIDPSYAVLPVMTLALTQYAWFVMFVRDGMLEVMREDYVQFAQANGLARVRILLRHALPNALIPFVTLVGTHLSEIIGGTILVEEIFGWPGLGQLTVRAALGSDIPLLIAITLCAATLVVGDNLLADVLYRVLDPRVREAA